MQLWYGDCRDILKDIDSNSVDLVFTDPPYPEIDRDYGRLSEQEWHDLMDFVMLELKRIVKPNGSVVVILQPNMKALGSMRTWIWEFMVRWSKKWNLVQDAYWWNVSTLPQGCTISGKLLRPSLKYCLWFGEPTCYRDQESVLWEESQSNAQRRLVSRCVRDKKPSGHSVNDDVACSKAVERGGVTPFNVLPIPNTNSVSSAGSVGHGAGTPDKLTNWWIRYLCPESGMILDPFMGSGTTGIEALKLSRDFLGIEKEKKYFEVAEKRIQKQSHDV